MQSTVHHKSSYFQIVEYLFKFSDQLNVRNKNKVTGSKQSNGVGEGCYIIYDFSKRGTLMEMRGN